MTRTLSRRTLLRGVFGGSLVSLALPPLEAMLDSHGEAWADEPGPIRRYGVFFWGNGYAWNTRGRPDRWTPTPGPMGWSPSEQLAPLGPDAAGRTMTDRVSVITGLEPKTAIPASPGGQGDGHMRGVAVALSGDRPRPEGFHHPDHIFALSRPTLDQVIARHPRFYATAPRFRSLELSVSGNRFHDYGTWTAISYNGPESQNLPIRSVDALFDQLFAVRTGDTADRALLLDAVADDARRLHGLLGANDRLRLDAHLEHVRTLQRELTGSQAACRMPARPTRGGGFDGAPGNEPLLDKLDAMARLLALALQCDMTRVFSLMFTGPGSQTVFRDVGATTGLHQLCHDENWELSRRATIYSMRCFRRLLDILAATPDVGGGSVLDNTVLLGTSEFSAGDVHEVGNFPVLLAGGGSGALRPGAHIHLPDGNLARVHLTIQQALGLGVDTFGFNGGETRESVAQVLR